MSQKYRKFRRVVVVTALVLGSLLAVFLIAGDAITGHQVVTDGRRELNRGDWQSAMRFRWVDDGPVGSGRSVDESERSPSLGLGAPDLYFSRRRAETGWDLFRSRWTPQGFGPAEPLFELNSASHDVDPVLIDRGRRLLFASDRPGGPGGYDLYVAEATDDGFGAPTLFDAALNSPKDDRQPTLDRSGNRIVFASSRLSEDGIAKDLYQSFRTGDTWQEPELIRELTTDGDGESTSPALSPDGRFLFFASDRSGGAGGFDLYRSFHYEGRWRTPEPLVGLNTPRDEVDPSLSQEGTTLVFSRTLQEGDGLAMELGLAHQEEVVRFFDTGDPLWQYVLYALASALLALLLTYLYLKWQDLHPFVKFIILSIVVHLLVLLYLATRPAPKEEPGGSGSVAYVVSFLRSQDAAAQGSAKNAVGDQVAAPRASATVAVEPAAAPAVSAPKAVMSDAVSAAPASRSGSVREVAPESAVPSRQARAAMASSSSQALEASERKTGSDPVAEGQSEARSVDGERVSSNAKVSTPGPSSEASAAEASAGVSPRPGQLAARSGPAASLEQPLGGELARRVLAPRAPAGSPGAATDGSPTKSAGGASEGSPTVVAERQVGTARRSGGVAAGALPSASSEGGANSPDLTPGTAAGSFGMVARAAGLESGEGQESFGAHERKSRAPRPAGSGRATSDAPAVARSDGEGTNDASPASARGFVGDARPSDLVHGRPNLQGTASGSQELAVASSLEGRSPVDSTAGALVSAAPTKGRRGPGLPSVQASSGKLDGEGSFAGPTLPEGRGSSRPRTVLGARESWRPPGPRQATSAPGPGGARGALAQDLLSYREPKFEAEAAPVVSVYGQRRGTARLEALKRGGGSDETERAVLAGLRYLKSRQRDTGGFGAPTRDRKYGDFRIGKSGLAVLAFLGSGYTHQIQGEFQLTVSNALAFLTKEQDRTTGHIGDSSAYGHGIATYALAEAYALSKDPSLERPLRRAVERILSAQTQGHRDGRLNGGWGYYYRDLERSYDRWPRMSVSVWQIMALESARLAGIGVPDAAFDAARNFVQKAFDPQLGAFRYNHDPEWLSNAYPTLPGSTSAALFASQILGMDADDVQVRSAVQYCLDRLPPPRWRRYSDREFATQGRGNEYFLYYATLGLYFRGGESWDRWNKAMTRLLVDSQAQDGSWQPASYYAQYANDTNEDRCYTTAMCVLMLEVYYRYFTPLLEAVVKKAPTPTQPTVSIVIESIDAGSSAEAMGLRQGDVLQSINGTVIHSIEDLQALVGRLTRRSRSQVVVLRAGARRELDLAGRLGGITVVEQNP